jgi:hypothetical protein
MAVDHLSSLPLFPNVSGKKWQFPCVKRGHPQNQKGPQRFNGDGKGPVPLLRCCPLPKLGEAALNFLVEGFDIFGVHIQYWMPLAVLIAVIAIAYVNR